MSTKTKSEGVFEGFLTQHGIAYEVVPTAPTRRPDYIVTYGSAKMVFEVKELSEDDNFSTGQFGVSSRTVGDHIRAKVAKSKKQIQWGTAQGLPSVLLIYNNLDVEFQLFGTEDHDFLCAMYGEHTLSLERASGRIRDSFHGLNCSLTEERNTSFSALGRLTDRRDNIEMTLFENAFAMLPLPYDRLPPSWNAVRVQIERL